MRLVFNNVSKRFSDLTVVDSFNSALSPGELVALVGPSGCGKSTLLHMAAGLEMPTSGQITADGNTVVSTDPKRMLMFQENALYPWLTLIQNVALACELQNTPKKEALLQANAWLQKVQLAGFENYYPHQVSGGMRQRCALARAFITQPPILLLDEPFGALDALTRLTLQDVLLELIEEGKPTVLLVTHDVDEAIYLADRVIVFSSRPAQILKEFDVSSKNKTHDLKDFANVRAQILELLGINLSRPTNSNLTRQKDAA